MGRFTVDQEGNGLLPGATQDERERMRWYNWLIREGHPTTVKVDLAAVWDQIGRWPAREVERTTPQIHFAEGTEIIKQPLSLRHIVAHEAVVLEQTVQARELTYGEWYRNQLYTVTLPTAARALSVSVPALMTSFGLGSNLDVIADEFKLNRTQVKKLTELMTASEVLAFALLFCATKFVAGPLAIMVDLVAAGNLLEFYTSLVMAQCKMSGLIGQGEVLFLQNNQNYTEFLFSSCGHCCCTVFFSSLVFASGLLVGVDQAQSLHIPESQLPKECAGLPLPQQLADLTLAEVADLVPVIAPVLIPIFGPFGFLWYPTKPIVMAVQIATASICTYLQGSPSMDYQFIVCDLLSSEVPPACTTVKTEQQAEEDMMGVVRARTRKASVLPRDYAPVNWCNALLDRDGKPVRFPKPTEILRKIVSASLRTSSNSRSNYPFKKVQIANRFWKEPVGYTPTPYRPWTGTYG